MLLVGKFGVMFRDGFVYYIDYEVTGYPGVMYIQ